MKYVLLISILFLSSCCGTFRPQKYKIGQKVTNGYCTGFIADVMNITERQYFIVNAKCGQLTMSSVWLKEWEITGEAQ